MSERTLLFMMKPEQLEAFLRLQQAAERGDGGAACRLGDMYREGLGGLRYSPKETYRWYAKSALAGDPNGQNNLGACYEHGLGCVQSYPKAVKWYRLSAAQKLGTASMNLGYCYLRGHGVPSDKVEALRLFRLAVEQGEDKAAQEVERLERDRDLTWTTGSSNGPQPTGVATRPRGHAVDPSVEARSRLLPRDGPPGQLQHLWTAGARAMSDEPDRELQGSEPSAGQSVANEDSAGERPRLESEQPDQKTRIRYLDVTEAGKHFGLVGVGGVPPPPPWEDEGLRLELLDVLSTGTASPADGAEGPTDEELFPIFAEGGLKPDDLVEGIAERYAAYLESGETI